MMVGGIPDGAAVAVVGPCRDPFVGSSTAVVAVLIGDLGGTPFDVEGPAVDGPETEADGLLTGLERFVERLTMSFPWTMRLSFDFLRSRVSISNDDC